MQRVVAFLRRPPGRPLILVTVGIGLVTAWAVSVPGSYFFTGLTSMLVWLALALAGFVRLVLAFIDPASRTDIRRHWVRWVAMPAIAALTVAMVVTSAPLWLRFGLSRGGMTTYARSVVDTVPGTTDEAAPIADAPSRLGLFSVDRAEVIPGGMRFIVSGAGFIDPAGFAYSPNGVPPFIGEDTYEHLSGPWYLWTESF
jgi:hypothetical protein